MLALQWGDIDFEKATVHINNRVGTDRTPPFEIKDSDTRTIPIPSHTIDILVKWQSEAPEGVPYVVLDQERYKLVLSKWHKLRKEKKTWRNRLMANNSLRDFKQHLKRANIKPDGKLSIHTLRKSAGQNWADVLQMNVVKELMGHSSIATTAEFYNQVDKQHRIQAANSIQNMLEKAAETESQTAKG
jgi:integrase